MSKTCFELRLEEMGNYVKELSDRSQSLLKLFNICVEDYNDMRKEGVKKRRRCIRSIGRECSEGINNNKLPENKYNEKELKRYSGKRIAPEGIINNRQIVTTTLKKKAIFSKLSNSEKELILYDKIRVGALVCERKWGIHHSLLTLYNQSSNQFKNLQEREIWIEDQNKKLGGYHNITANIHNIIIKSQIVLDENRSPIYSLQELCDISFDKGLGIVAVIYNINLFALQYLLKHLFPSEWDDMERNKWFSLLTDSHNNKIPMSKMDIVTLSNLQGVRYASKKSGVLPDAIARYRKQLSIRNEVSVSVPVSDHQTDMEANNKNTSNSNNIIDSVVIKSENKINI